MYHFWFWIMDWYNKGDQYHSLYKSLIRFKSYPFLQKLGFNFFFFFGGCAFQENSGMLDVKKELEILIIHKQCLQVPTESLKRQL